MLKKLLFEHENNKIHEMFFNRYKALEFAIIIVKFRT